VPVSVPKIPRLVCAAIVAIAAAAAVAGLSLAGPLANLALVHGLVFYAVTAAAYALLPLVRRGDVVMGAVWLVLAAGVAPCVLGQEISAPRMFADMAGVLMAALPIYIARLRQVAQGDMREPPLRRQTERETPLEEAPVEEPLVEQPA
jgi:hypothetical protein